MRKEDVVERKPCRESCWGRGLCIAWHNLQTEQTPYGNILFTSQLIPMLVLCLSKWQSSLISTGILWPNNVHRCLSSSDTPTKVTALSTNLHLWTPKYLQIWALVPRFSTAHQCFMLNLAQKHPEGQSSIVKSIFLNLMPLLCDFSSYWDILIAINCFTSLYGLT